MMEKDLDGAFKDKDMVIKTSDKKEFDSIMSCLFKVADESDMRFIRKKLKLLWCKNVFVSAR